MRGLDHMHEDKTTRQINLKCQSLQGRFTLTASTQLEDAATQPPASMDWLHKRIFQLHDAQTHNLIWSVVHRSSPPRQMWVSTTGYVSILCQHDELLFIHPSGRISPETSVLEALEHDSDFERHARTTMSGLLWDETPIGIFFESGKRWLFCLRPHWGRRLVFDTESAQMLPLNRTLMESVRAAEEQWVVARLTAGRDHLIAQSGCSPESAVWIGLASELAWQEGSHQAVPLLRELELLCAEPGESHDSPALEPNAVTPFLADPCSTRRSVQEALLRLGHQPAGCAVYALLAADATPLPTPPRPSDWQFRLDDITSGMQAHEVLKLVGTPFFADQDIQLSTEDGHDVKLSVWEYDVLGSTGGVETVRIEWDGSRVHHVVRLHSAPWPTEPYRSRHLHRVGVCFCMRGFTHGSRLEREDLP